jgi:hypothetical protein
MKAPKINGYYPSITLPTKKKRKNLDPNIMTT